MYTTSSELVTRCTQLDVVIIYIK